MKQLIALLFSITPIAAFAHPGHQLTEKAHSLLHGEHVLILLAIVVLLYIVTIIRNK